MIGVTASIYGTFRLNEASNIEAETRFAFGDNWARYLSILTEERISVAEESLKTFLEVDNLQGQRFLDIGSGSGLFSLAARRLGAVVTSFDLDPQSIACTEELKRRYFAGDKCWRIEHGSAIDRDYLRSLGKFDVVYSWGVLHHTGAMWLGIDNAIGCVANDGGQLFIAIYNDQGWKSHFWWFIKLWYNRLPRILRKPYLMLIEALMRLFVFLKYLFRLKPAAAIKALLPDKSERGMSARHDMVDWVGGFPYEFAALDTLIEYIEARGFSVIRADAAESWGCHQLAVRRESCAE